MLNRINCNKIEENLATGQELHCKMSMLWVTVCNCMLLSRTHLPKDLTSFFSPLFSALPFMFVVLSTLFLPFGFKSRQEVSLKCLYFGEITNVFLDYT